MAKSLGLTNREAAIWSRGLSGEELGRAHFEGRITPFSPCSLQHCPQTATEVVLLKALACEPCVSVDWNVEVCGVTPGDSSVSVQLSTGENAESEWLIAADGASSGIRHAVGIPTDGPGDMGHFINILFEGNLGELLGDRRAVIYHAVGQDYLEMFVTIDGSSTWLMHHFLLPGERAEDFDEPGIRDLILRAAGFPGLDVRIRSVSPWVMSPKVARQWRAGRVLLVGDAAARLSPAGGLGMNNGLQCAHNLAWKLAAVICGGAPDSLLDSYDAERRSAALHLMEYTNRTSDEVFGVVAAAERGDWDAAKELISRSRRHGKRLGVDLGVTYDCGAFIPDGTTGPQPEDPVNDYMPSGQPGTRAPHLSLSNGSLLDFLGSHFVVLAGRTGECWQARRGAAHFFQNGVHFDAVEFESVYGIGADGCVLVRPDGYIAARMPDAGSLISPEMALQQVLSGTSEM